MGKFRFSEMPIREQLRLVNNDVETGLTLREIGAKYGVSHAFASHLKTLKKHVDGADAEIVLNAIDERRIARDTVVRELQKGNSFKWIFERFYDLERTIERGRRSPRKPGTDGRSNP